MNRIFSCVLAFSSLATAAAVAESPPFEQRAAVECEPSGGLPNLLARLKSGQEVRVAYLGGSITAAPGWRVKSLAWLKQKYPDAELSEIDAAIGGTGSDLGVFRLEHDVLQHKPTMLFVEFAVNDGGADPVQIQRTMEGIVRQTWRADPATDICFVYTTSDPFFADLKAGKASRAASAMEIVADHYKIPSIQLGMEVAELEKSGKLIFKGAKPKEAAKPGKPIIFSEDAVHPLDAGHELYLQAIARSWPKIEKASAAAGPHALGDPLRADNYEQAKLVAIGKEMLKGAWKQQDLAKDSPAQLFAKRVPSMWKGSEPGASLEFDLEGSYAAAYDLLAPDGGILEVRVDDRPPTKTTRFDGYCVYPRLATALLLNEPTSGKHHVKITLLAEAPDKAKILFPNNRADMEKNPEKYKDNVWYVGGLLVVGSVGK